MSVSGQCAIGVVVYPLGHFFESHTRHLVMLSVPMTQFSLRHRLGIRWSFGHWIWGQTVIRSPVTTHSNTQMTNILIIYKQ